VTAPVLRITLAPPPVARRRAWYAVLAAGIALAVAGVQAPPPLSTIAIVVSGALPLLAVLASLRWVRPARPRPWIAIGGGLALYWLGNVAGLAGLVDRNGLATQLITVAGYTGLLAGIVDLLNAGDAETDVSTILEALVLATAAALLTWFLFLAPLRLASGISADQALAALGYPAIDLGMFAVAGRTLLRYRRIAPSLWLLLPALVASTASDLAGLVAYANGQPLPAWLGVGGSLVGNGFVAAAAAHPSVARQLLAGPRPIGRYVRVRIALVGAAVVTAPLLMLLLASRSQLALLPELGIGALLISALVVSDLFLVLFRLEGSLRTRVALERELQRQAETDSLTGMPNRAAFVTRLEAALRVDRRHVALLFCDLDDFKRVNDTLGHAAGDQLLIEVGRRLQGAIHGTDVAARLGGDEFAVLLTGLADRDDADLVAERLLHACGVPVVLGDQRYRVRLSIGIAFGADTSGASELMRDADVAMYLAKHRGKGAFERFRPLPDATSVRYAS
jgi:diguanylate cyclase (GGDEF)-like protein